MQCSNLCALLFLVFLVFSYETTSVVYQDWKHTLNVSTPTHTTLPIGKMCQGTMCSSIISNVYCFPWCIASPSYCVSLFCILEYTLSLLHPRIYVVACRCFPWNLCCIVCLRVPLDVGDTTVEHSPRRQCLTSLRPSPIIHWGGTSLVHLAGTSLTINTAQVHMIIISNWTQRWPPSHCRRSYRRRRWLPTRWPDDFRIIHRDSDGIEFIMTVMALNNRWWW